VAAQEEARAVERAPPAGQWQSRGAPHGGHVRPCAAAARRARRARCAGARIWRQAHREVTRRGGREVKGRRERDGGPPSEMPLAASSRWTVTSSPKVTPRVALSSANRNRACHRDSCVYFHAFPFRTGRKGRHYWRMGGSGFSLSCRYVSLVLHVGHAPTTSPHSRRERREMGRGRG